MAIRPGEEFRDDLRAAGSSRNAAGSANAAARGWLSAEELAPLTRLDNLRSALALAQTLLLAVLAVACGALAWPSPWIVLPVILVGLQQHAMFVLAHEAAHYRLFSIRVANDVVGRLIGMAGGLSMCTYRVVHRLHHNHLYGADDPDTAIHGGYPRGVAYLWRKLALDLVGWNARKNFAYFFGAPALNDETSHAARPLDDTSTQLRAHAGADRRGVIAFQVAAPVLCFAFFGARGLAEFAVLWWLPLVTVLQPILRLRAICEHGATFDFSSPLTAARTHRVKGFANRIGRAVLFPHHVNYHVEHHLYPAVPHYHLPRLHRLLASKGALADAEVRDVADTLRLVFSPRRTAPAYALDKP